jgi:hypothetical protein
MALARVWVVISESFRHFILQDLVQMHQGATKMKQQARLSIYWSGMDNDIENAVKSCKHYTENQPLIPREPFRQRNTSVREIQADKATVNGRDFEFVMTNLVDGHILCHS